MIIVEKNLCLRVMRILLGVDITFVYHCIGIRNVQVADYFIS